MKFTSFLKDMILFLILPLIVTIICAFGVLTSILANAYILPLLGFGEIYNISIGMGIVIVFILVFICYLIFSKQVESYKFKVFRFMNK